MRILIIIPYFGTWPLWIKYFLQSCAYNSSIHWLLYTDCTKPTHYPNNIRFESKNLDDFNTLASEKLDFGIEINYPYKICDLKPAFGQIFSDYLDDYDFWGYADLDLIFGNISSFLTDDLLEMYDVISVRENYLAGHFTLYRNTGIINDLYTKSNKYKQIFQDSNHYYGFDEISNSVGKKLPIKSSIVRNWWICKNLVLFLKKIQLRLNPALIKIEFPDMSTITKRAAESGEIKLYRKDLVRSDLLFEKYNNKRWEMLWKDGELKDLSTGERYLHFHLIKSKERRKFRIEPFKPHLEFRIRPIGITSVQHND